MSRFFKVKFLFLLFTIFGFAFLFFYFGKGGLSFHEINLWFLFPILLSAILDLFFGSLRMYVFAKPVAPEVSLYECIIANIASIASAVLTPSQTGGGIACLYFLKKAGCPLTAALALSIINFLFTLMVLIGGGLFLFFIKSSLLTPKLSILIQSAIAFLSLWTVATIFALLFPSPTLSIWQRISSLFHLRKLLLIFEMALKGYSHYVSFYLFKNLDILLKSFFINALLILDLMLPQIDGWELCHILRKNSDEKIKNLPIIMLTARASVEDRSRISNGKNNPRSKNHKFCIFMAFFWCLFTVSISWAVFNR